jgi:O-succinylbenzoic acid--CoA ligase
MTRALRRVPTEALGVLAALREALSGSGPAIMVTGSEGAIPDTVPQRVAVVVETSGSTARPKRVAISSDALLASAAASASFVGGDGQWLLALPTHYVAGLNVLVRSIASDTQPVILADGSFDPGAFVRAADTMDAERRFTSLVPAQLGRLLDERGAVDALRRFDRILVGGQPTPQNLIDRAAELDLKITRTYGSSETCGGCVYDGVPIGNTRFRIVDGQVELAGAVLAEGYLGDDQRTAEVFVDDEGTRWYRTGDSGEVAGDRLVVTGRLDDILISGGIKVSLGEVERIVRGIAGHSDAVAVRSASERWGEVPVVVTTEPIELEELREAVRAQLGNAAAPARVIVVDRIPMLDSGKPDRVGLQRLAQ